MGQRAITNRFGLIAIIICNIAIAGCGGGGGSTGSSCTFHASKACYDGDVYWYNSCGNRGEIYKDCGSDVACSNGLCVFTWNKTFGKSGLGLATSIQQTTDGGYIVVGSNDYDLWLCKLDIEGNNVWEKTIVKAESDIGRSVQQTTDGGYIVAADSTSFGDGSYDAWILKFDGSGNKVWEKVFGESDEWDVSESIQQTTDGGYIIAGGTGFYDFWIYKLDAYGNKTWEKTFSGTNIARYVQQTSDGGYIAAGNTIGTSFDDISILKLDNSGNQIWLKTFGGTNYEDAWEVHQTSGGGYIVGGITDSYGGGNYDGLVLKLDGSGNITWEKTFGGSENDEIYSIQPTSDSGYIVAGKTYSLDPMKTLWIFKLDSAGNQLWEKTYSGEARSVRQTIDSGYIIAGDISGDANILKLDANGNCNGCTE